MPTLEITLTVPEGTTINIAGLGESNSTASLSDDPVERYWRYYLSNNTRKLLAAAARLEDVKGPGFTLEDIASNLSVDYESARSYKQTLGRPAKRWREETGTPEPIQLNWGDYHAAGEGMRTVYYLPEGMADGILELAAQFMVAPYGDPAS